MLCGNVTLPLIHRPEHVQNQGRVQSSFCLNNTEKRGVGIYDIFLPIGDGDVGRL
jgi:hypothetical protein